MSLVIIVFRVSGSAFLKKWTVKNSVFKKCIIKKCFFKKVRGCLVCVFKQLFLVFKQYYTPTIQTHYFVSLVITVFRVSGSAF